MNVAQTSLDPPHFPVMLKEIIEICTPKKGGNFVDCTFGGGGYSQALLEFPKTKIASKFLCFNFQNPKAAIPKPQNSISKNSPNGKLANVTRTQYLLHFNRILATTQLP